MEMTHEEVKKHFDRLDKDKSGTLEPEEVNKFFKRVCSKETADKYAEEFINEYGGDDKKLDLDEFKSYLTKEVGFTIKD